MKKTIYSVPLRLIDGTHTTLRVYRGKVMLIVNVASECGLTPQYAGLEQLYQEKRGDGLIVGGFPSNDFGAQEPGTNQQIANFCSTQWHVTFPVFEKIVVKGNDIHPLYRLLIDAYPRAQERSGEFRAKLAAHGMGTENGTDILWNFEKFLISRKGKVVGRFSPDITPEDASLRRAIQQELVG
jgi:glutathione peroxidase